MDIKLDSDVINDYITYDGTKIEEDIIEIYDMIRNEEAELVNIRNTKTPLYLLSIDEEYLHVLFSSKDRKYDISRIILSERAEVFDATEMEFYKNSYEYDELITLENIYTNICKNLESICVDCDCIKQLIKYNIKVLLELFYENPNNIKIFSSYGRNSSEFFKVFDMVIRDKFYIISIEDDGYKDRRMIIDIIKLIYSQYQEYIIELIEFLNFR